MHLYVDIDETIINSVELSLNHADVDIGEHTLPAPLDDVLAAQVCPLDLLHIITLLCVAEPTVPIRLTNLILFALLIGVFLGVIRLKIILFNHRELLKTLLFHLLFALNLARLDPDLQDLLLFPFASGCHKGRVDEHAE